MSSDSAPSQSGRFFIRRTLILGVSVFAASVISGIGMLFWREHGDHLFTTASSEVYRTLIQATLGPLFIGFLLLWITAPVMMLLIILAVVGSKMRRIWLSMLVFVLMGIYWLWLVHLISKGVFDD